MSRSPARGRWFRDSSLQFKALTALGALMALFALTCLLFLRNQAHVREAAEWTAHTYDAIDHADNLMVHLVEQQNALRGYVVYKRADVKAQLQEAAEAFDRDYDRIQALTADNPTQQIRLHQVQRLMQAWRDEFAAAVSLAVETEPAGGRAEDLLRNGQGPRMIDAVRQELQHIIAEERRLLAGRNERLAQELTRIRWLALGMLVAGLALSALSVILIRRIVADPLTQLTGLIQRLRAGELEVEVPHQERGDELGEIARAIEGFRAASLDTQRSEWIKNHLNAVAVLMSQQHGYARFGEALLGYLCPALGVGQGALLRTTDDQMQTIASYGLVGEVAMDGLARQCLSSGRPITLDALPEDYVRIASATGAARARYLYLWPLPGLERPAGVLELASFAPLAARERELLAEVARLAGLALESLGNALRTRELLEETQAQSEELQASEEALRAQQEELRATNEALGVKNQALAEQGQRLRASEEELKVQAEELRTTNEELQERGRVLNEFNDRLQSFQKELEARNEDLQQASRYKSEFLANMSHELRTPLNSLLILAKDLADNGSGNLDAEQVESARIIHDSGHNLLKLINDILDLSKIEAGRMDVSWEELPLEPFLRGLERSFKPLARDRGLALRIEMAPQVPAQIVTDGARLTQILTNLLGNALKFTHAGSVSLTVSAPSPETIEIAVRDSGIGIPPEKLARLFQAFEQGDGTTSRRYGGTGLGLSISRGLAQLLGGDIRAESTAGEGSCFTLHLPRRPPSAGTVAVATEAPAAPEIATAPPAAPVRGPQLPDDRDAIAAGDRVILIVDDDPSFARILADMARRKNYRVLLAGDGETALELARDYSPHGILLDIGLPGIDGWTVQQRLKDHPLTRDIPVHFISAADEAARGLALGAVGFLTKPATRDSLDAALGRVMAPDADAPRRVLVLDDDASSRQAIVRLLGEVRAEITEARTAEEALAVLGQQRHDCVIVDLGLPGVSGFGFLEQLSRHPPVPPIVIYSGRELSREEDLKLREYTDSIVIKGTRAQDRLLDEVSLFLHAMAGPSRSAAPASAASGDLSGRSVLVVDDDMRNVFALSKSLRGQGLNVVVAQDGYKALEQLEQHPEIDWVLMDVMMPGMDGYEAMREIRKRPQWRELPVIAVTAKAMKGDREKCLEAGANDYLTKPIDMEKLLSLLRVWARSP